MCKAPEQITDSLMKPLPWPGSEKETTIFDSLVSELRLHQVIDPLVVLCALLRDSFGSCLLRSVFGRWFGGWLLDLLRVILLLGDPSLDFVVAVDLVEQQVFEIFWSPGIV